MEDIMVHNFSKPTTIIQTETYENKKGELSWDLLHLAATR